MSEFLVIGSILLAGLCIAWGIGFAYTVWGRLREARVVTCPETGTPAMVHVDVRRALATALTGQYTAVHLDGCSRWPSRGRCDERCLADALDMNNTPTRIAERAFAGRSCVFCAKPIDNPQFLDHYAAVRRPDGVTVQWPRIPAEQLRETLGRSDAVCWDCHIAETFRREHPELVTDRPWPR